MANQDNLLQGYFEDYCGRVFNPPPDREIKGKLLSR